ncbi:MAG: hypothetical protein HEQ23_15715 [Tepidisphaera sp.]
MSPTQPTKRFKLGSIQLNVWSNNDRAGKPLEASSAVCRWGWRRWISESFCENATAWVGYDEMGRVLRAVEPTGTITRSVYDTLGRTTERWVGTDDSGLAGSPMSGTSNMVKTESMVYDGGNSGGNSLLTQITRYPDGATGTRVTSYQYDTRDRQVLTIDPQSPHSVVKYDSAGRVIASGTYSSSSGLSATTDPTSVTTNRLSLSETAYDEAGRVYSTTSHKITVSTGASAATLVSDTWHDVVGRTIKSRGSSISKTFYDRQSRPYRQFTIAKLQDNAGTGTESDTDIAQAGTVTGDLVLEERQTIYDTASGLTLFTVALQRAHDDTTTTGARDGNGDADLTTLTVASGGSNVDYTTTRVSISATWYDDLRRPIASAAFGSNSTSSGAAGNGATFTRPGSAPSRSDTVLVTSMSYNANGTVLETTDPRGLVSRNVLDDAGRTVKTIRNYTDGTPGGGTNNDQDQTIEYGFSKGLMTTYTAKMPGGTDQVTTYIYGTTKGATAGLSAIATGHLLRATKYPDSSNGGTTVANIDSTDTDLVSVAYNALGQEIRRKDQAGNVTETTYDTGGRPTIRAVTTLASGFDGAVRRVQMDYTSKGQPNLITQYDAASSGNVTDEVQYLYDDWGNATNFRQDKDGTVAGGGYREVAYTYSSSPYQATGGAQAVRLETITLPGGKDIDLSYGTATGIDDCVSRVASVKDVLVRSPLSTITLANYDYFGSGTLVGTELPQPAAESMLYGAGTANYDRLDLFNRVIESRWTRTNGSQIYYVKLGYDRDSNIVTAEDEILPGYDAKYDMDGLNRLIVADEGTLSSGTIGSRTRKETWTLNQVGGWSTFTSDLNGDGSFTSPAFGPSDEKNETRTFNTVNEMATRVNNSVTKNPAYNANGQQTDDGVNYTYEWDAFGRLRKVKNRSNSALVVEYTYNGLNHQIGRHADLDADGDVDSTDMWEWTVYDPRWRRVATYMVAGGSTFTGAVDSNPRERYVHHASGRNGMGSYIDSVILRDRDQTGSNNSSADATMEQRLYYGQNWRADVSVTMTETGRILERIKYSAYGVAMRVPVTDFNLDGFVDAFDDIAYDDCYTGVSCPSGQTADMNLDGFVDSFDYDEWDLTFSEQGSTARGVLSQSSGSAAVNRLGYAGYWFEPSTQQYLVRNREFEPLAGIWSERDPLEYVDGSNLYGYVNTNPVLLRDADGLISRSPCIGGCTATNDPRATPAGEVRNDLCLLEQARNSKGCPRVVRDAYKDTRVLAIREDLKRACNQPDLEHGHCAAVLCLPCNDNDCLSRNVRTIAGIMGVTRCTRVAGRNCPLVVLCTDREPITPPEHYDNTVRLLVHELTHARQCCENGPPVYCGDLICNEIEAYCADANPAGICNIDDATGTLTQMSQLCTAACGSVVHPRCPSSDCHATCLRLLENSRTPSNRIPRCHRGRVILS